ncbi:MAG: Smr/MutS family protein, partial [Mucispirillum sp.]|nr:Smr/MutS family protein [Mucispirillum sp.]
LQKSRRLANQKEKLTNDEIEHAIKKTSSKIENIKSKQITIEDIKVNDIIFLDKYNSQVKILDISGNNVTVDLNGMKMKMKKNDIVGHKIEQVKPKTVKITSNISKSSSKREIVLVGMRVEEALDLLEKFIDDLLLTSYDKAYIVHGRGSGQLRKAVHEYLRVHPKVVKYCLAENNDGGNAVTIIEL